MGPLPRMGFYCQRVFDCSLVVLAVGCGWIGYDQVENEDPAAKRERLQREDMRRQRLKTEEAKRRFEQIKDLSRRYEEKIELLSQKRQQVLYFLKMTQSFSSRLRRRHKELEIEIEELRRRVKAKEEIQARSIGRDEFESKNDDSGGI